MANARNLRLGPNATYIPLTHVGGFAIGDAKICVTQRKRYQHVGIGNAKVWHLGSKPTPVPNANGFALQWTIGFILQMLQLVMLAGAVALTVSETYIPNPGLDGKWQSFKQSYNKVYTPEQEPYRLLNIFYISCINTVVARLRIDNRR